MADFHVKIISSNRTFYEGVCHCLILPAVDGEMAVMAHHESEIVAVKAGEMRISFGRRSVVSAGRPVYIVWSM